ncbi:cellulase family glycosylhydrolase [Erythrobacter sp. LQ02-29]|uniref:glycoside hydrolase 5 family protein n=1 Tax=Erythrobacter sp. LQ02-29 TaxID=2920384 RepID=UPI001F4EFA5E|nr:cellulase family glycosylhydrolase [Erythrobacter sp. LQ02-29]MCP9223541.1 cellulase family glycosylhydrolase [Erythrobacter sp. LQ02-29]
MKVSRRALLANSAMAVTLAGCGRIVSPAPPTGFVSRNGSAFLRDAKPYRVTSANMWYAAWLGADTDYGDRARLRRELDRLQALGINNLRIMASAEEGPLNHSIKPGFTRADGSPNPALFAGLDYAMAELGKRGMTAVLVLSNFWEWSGGLQTLLWRATGTYMDMGDPAHPWPAFADATAQFYANETAREFYDTHLQRIVGRTNTITGRRYVDDPAIFSWQLANEPRAGGSDAAIARNKAAYYDWIDTTAARLRALDPNHMVSLGQEGTEGCNGQEAVVLRAHRNVDYLTAHIWPLNWEWADGDDLQGTWPTVQEKTSAYLDTHERLARDLGKPMIVEEFGFPRDGESYDPAAKTEWRQRFYRLIYDAVEDSWRRGGPIAGSGFWAWNGEARAAHGDYRFADGDHAYMGDPPHEPQGWYGNFDSDAGMLAVIRAHTARRDLGLPATAAS